ncbi:MAG: alcohol dehydrogenase catalytic domain-containing protein [Nitrososphaeria archaeon]
MRAVVFHGQGKISVEDAPIPQVREGTILMKVQAAAICATDLRIFRGEKNAKQNVILGHEFAGEVVKIGDKVEDFSLGEHIGFYPVIADGRCDYCIRGFRNRCVNRKTVGIDLDGGFAEYFLVPEEAVRLGNCIRLPDNVSYEEAALLEPISTVINSVEKLDIGYGDTVLIVGAGPMGLIHVILTKLRGAAQVMVSDPVDERLIVAQKLGATETINPKRVDLAKAIIDCTKGTGVNKVFLTVGIPEVVEQLLEIVQSQGKISLFAGGGKTYRSNIDLNKIHYKELMLTATQNATLEHFKKGLKMIEGGSLDVRKLITHKFSLENAMEAFSLRDELKALKVLLVP